MKELRMMEKSLLTSLFLLVVLLLLPAVRGGDEEVQHSLIPSYNYEPVPIYQQYLLPEEDVVAPPMQQQASALNSQAVLGMVEYLILLILLKGSVTHISDKYYASLPHIRKSYPSTTPVPPQNPDSTEIPFYGIDLPWKSYKNKH